MTYSCVVTLHTEEEAVIELTGLESRDLDDATLRELALQQLDKSGGAEWVCTQAHEFHEWSAEPVAEKT